MFSLVFCVNNKTFAMIPSAEEIEDSLITILSTIK